MKLRLPATMKTKEKDILSTAAMLFKRYGFKKVSVEEICRYAGVSKATFYKYYEGKEGVIRRFLEIMFEDMIKRSYDMLHSDLDLKDKFDKVIIMKLEFIDELGEEVVKALYDYPLAQKFYEEIQAKSLQDFRRFLLNEQSQGRIDPEINMDLILAVLGEFARLFAEHRFESVCPDFHSMVAQVNKLLVFGLLGPSAR